MGPPVGQGAPAVPKMGVRARMADWPRMRDIWDSQPPPRYDSLVPSFVSGTPQSCTPLKTSTELQTRSETRYALCDLLSPSPRRSLMRMKRSNSEVTISDIGAEDLDPAAVNPKTGATLRREYGSTSTLDQQNSTGFMETLRLGQQPSAPPPLPEPPHFKTPLSQSLQTAAQIAQGDVIYIPGDDYVDASVFYYGDRERVQRKTETGIFSRLRSQRTDGDHMQKQDMRFSRGLTSQKCFSHYDVQSILFNISESFTHRADLRKNTSAGPSGGSQWQDAPDPGPDVVVGGCDDLETFSDCEDRQSNSLVLSCPFFQNEIGGETERNLGLTRSSSTHSELVLNSRCSSAGVSVLEVCRENQVFPQNLIKNYDIEHIDLGAKYYLKYFYNRDHQNYFGADEKFGAVSLSIRREKLEDRKDSTQYNYRIILRTSQLSTLRGSILEDSIPSSSKHGTARGLPLKDVLEFVVPDLNIQSLRLATSSPRVPELLLQLDQQELNFQHKVGVLFCRAGQTTEEQMYNNETGSPALDQFLDLLGHRVRLKGFTKYRAQLDTTGDSTGSHSVYTTFREFELMFHVSTLLPYTANDTQQVLRKRHIENNTVTVIFQEPNAPPFSPRNIRSHFQHVFVIVRVHQPCSQHTCYRVAVSRCRDVPSFGPLIPAGQMFPASSTFRDFLLTKIINAEHAVHRSEKFVAMATCSRREHLKELVENFASSTSVDSSSSARFSFISLGGKKKERSVPRPQAHLQSGGALTWSVTAQDFSRSAAIACQLAVSSHAVVLIEEATRQVVFNCYCREVIGWSAGHRGIKLFYEHGDCLMFSTQEGSWEDVREITQRLQAVTRGGVAVEMTLRRNRLGELGFHVNFEGVVADVEAHSLAWQAGLRSGCRLMEICGVAVVTLSHEQMIELLRTSATVSVVVVPPNRDGTARRSFSEIYRVQVIEYKLDSDVTSCSFRAPPLTCHQVSAAPPPPRHSSDQSAASEPERQSSCLDVKEGSRMPQVSSPSSRFWCSPSNQSTSSDPGPSVTLQNQIHGSGHPDWSMSSDEHQSRLERTRRTRSTESSCLHHHRHVTKVLKGSQLSPTDRQLTSAGKLSSSNSSSNTLSSSSSDDRRSEKRGLTCTAAPSTDSGIDSAPCSASVPPHVAGATLILRDVWGEGPETRGTNVTPLPGHVTDLSDTCSLSSDSRGSTLSGRRPEITSSPEAFITCDQGAGPSRETRPSEGEGPYRSEGGSLLEEADRLQQLLTSDLQFDSRPIREVFVRMMRSVAAGEQVFPVQSVLTLTRSMSDDSLYRTTVSHRSMPRPQTALQRSESDFQNKGELCHSDSSLAERSRKPLPQVTSHLSWSHVVDATRVFEVTGVFSSLSLHQDVRVTSQRSPLQDSDITATSLSGKVFQLEEILRQLQLDLLKEQQDKAALQQQVLNLRQNNLRLQEESQSAADHIRRFAAWLLQRSPSP
ncbi:signal-induced proliferation-associated 1-like protein 2 isoform X2 [Lates calcarifer]|uniref:Signal-induced proliferation-associated 1-like protein 2 isoform X2 n=1 Tax=Lates calcarifer TaxID=8187 RepID=A0AAJ7LT64_LATCA|nr:signal-induced proliferation-associated 1-like protein 2 isoform X2 [Lates calcarifer]